ncbi:hypothetical protein [Ardenticatena maritima]|nr:hypothetical protein [Ardenticatena maritima]
MGLFGTPVDRLAWFFVLLMIGMLGVCYMQPSNTALRVLASIGAYLGLFFIEDMISEIKGIAFEWERYLWGGTIFMLGVFLALLLLIVWLFVKRR